MCYGCFEKNDIEANGTKDWGLGTSNYNPYAVCSSKISRSNRPDCFKSINLDILPLEGLRVIASSNNLEYHGTREQIINNIRKFYKNKV